MRMCHEVGKSEERAWWTRSGCGNIFKYNYQFPHSERVGGSTRTFNTEEEFLNFLTTESDADFLWMQHNDLQSICNIYKTNIHILSTGVPDPGPHGVHARWTKLSPDLSLVDGCETKVSVEDMFVYHIDDNHFDLLVRRNSRLAMEGDISIRSPIKDKKENEMEAEENDKVMKKSELGVVRKAESIHMLER